MYPLQSRHPPHDETAPSHVPPRGTHYPLQYSLFFHPNPPRYHSPHTDVCIVYFYSVYRYMPPASSPSWQYWADSRHSQTTSAAPALHGAFFHLSCRLQAILPADSHKKSSFRPMPFPPVRYCTMPVPSHPHTDCPPVTAAFFWQKRQDRLPHRSRNMLYHWADHMETKTLHPHVCRQFRPLCITFL